MSRPVLLWLGDELTPWGSAGAGNRLAGALAARSGWSVEPVPYDLGTFPRPLTLAYRCLGRAQARAREGTAVAIGGEGFGAGLAAAAALLTLRYEEEPPAAVVLLAPLLDARLSSPSWQRFSERRERAGIEAALEAYAPGLDRADPLLSPLHAERLEGLPTTVIVTAAADPMRDDGERFAQRLRAAGVTVLGHRYPDSDHAQVCGGGTGAEGGSAIGGLASALRLILSRSNQAERRSSSRRTDAPRPA